MNSDFLSENISKKCQKVSVCKGFAYFLSEATCSIAQLITEKSIENKNALMNPSM